MQDSQRNAANVAEAAGVNPGEVAQARALKDTLNLPKTAFPMKASLPVNEPGRLAQWEADDLYGAIRKAREGAPKYILHDGPPYANGAIHLGHALNKCIKDFVVKSKTMAGFDAPYVPGWDCHGLPIEIKVDEQLGRKKLEMDAVTVRQHCREYAGKYVDLQRSQFVRMGVLGRWNDPYLTMSHAYEARILETFYAFFEKEFVYKGLRPVYWCMHDKTALAEAEVEYEMHTSPSVYVRYALLSDAAAIAPDLAGAQVYGLIWTTTPWTLPASLAIAFHPEFDYVALKNSDGAVYLVALGLVDAVRAACHLEAAAEVARFKGSALEHARFQHPFLPREVLGVMADYVTTDAGTGGVHTAPAHGPDDFATGKKYALSQVCDVDEAGRLRNGLPEYDNLNVHKANQPIIELLKSKGALLAEQEIHHSYPHCWRCHKPVIYRATEQWFIGMETPVRMKDGSETTFRQRALDEIKAVTWDPSWGEERISNMIATRPDWCISRQRIWGVPIAVFLCQKCHAPLMDPAVNRSIVDLFAKESADAWYTHSAEQLLPAGTTCKSCGAQDDFRKEMDILDVWFESGASWHAVLEAEPELRFPADLYTEGGDQHRGWFHSSLLSAVGIRDEAPYKYVATSGWTLDEQRRAFSKSLGNGVDPVKVMNELGGDIVRLWVASVDFREDVIASVPLMKRLAEEIYRKLRNTFRFLLANLDGFAPQSDAVAWGEMEALDQYMLARCAEVVTKVRSAYDSFEFHRAYHALNEFCNSELSAFYLDVLKDRLYTLAPKDTRRLSAQTAVWKIAEALVRLVAPVLSFTADEVWGYLPEMAGREASVHIAEFPSPTALAPVTGVDVEDWHWLFNVRTQALRMLESARQQGKVGKALEASLLIRATAEKVDILQKYQSSLPEFFGVSVVSVGEVVSVSGAAKETFGERTFADNLYFRYALVDDMPVTIELSLNPLTKCERCWRRVSDVGIEAKYPTVCARCADALEKIGFAPYAVEAEVA